MITKNTTKSPLKSLLVFDADSSMASVGGPDQQTETFGMRPIPVMGGISTVTDNLSKLFIAKSEQYNHELLGPQGKKITVKKREVAKNVSGVAIDTLSTLGESERKLIKEESGKSKFTFDEWAEYGNRVKKLLQFIKHLPVPVIVTSHVDTENDEFTGYQHQVPLIKGSTKSDMGKYFDVVLFAETKLVNGASKHQFLIKPSKIQHSKDRLNIFPDERYVDQDLGPFIQAYKEKRLPAKILICGRNGTGKTSSLATATGMGRYAGKEEANTEEESHKKEEAA